VGVASLLVIADVTSGNPLKTLISLTTSAISIELQFKERATVPRAPAKVTTYRRATRLSQLC